MKTIAIAVLLLGAAAAHAERPYSEGTVWGVTMIRGKPGMFDDYAKSLGATWKKGLEEAKKQKLILSYKVLSAPSANPHDWDLLLLVEYKNMAALDGLDDKMETLFTKIVGGEEAASRGTPSPAA